MFGHHWHWEQDIDPREAQGIGMRQHGESTQKHVSEDEDDWGFYSMEHIRPSKTGGSFSKTRLYRITAFHRGRVSVCWSPVEKAKEMVSNFGTLEAYLTSEISAQDCLSRLLNLRYDVRLVSENRDCVVECERNGH